MEILGFSERKIGRLGRNSFHFSFHFLVFIQVNVGFINIYVFQPDLFERLKYALRLITKEI